MFYIRLKSNNPYYNLATEECLLQKACNQFILVWQNDNAVVIGKNQDKNVEVDMEYALENDIKIARRMTGGGAVYHDLGNVNFSFILPLGESYISDSVAFIISMLKGYGIDAQKSGRNDLCVNDKKICGMAMAEMGEYQLLHGTLMYQVNMEVLEKVLTPEMSKLQRHGIKSVKNRVANIKEIVNKEEDTDAFISFIEKYIKREMKVQEYIFTDEERNEIQERSRYIRANS